MPSITYDPISPTLIGSFRQFLAVDPSKALVASFNLNTATGNQSVTGLGFQPTFVMIIGMRLIGWANNGFTAVLHIGAATATAQWAIGFWSDNGGGASAGHITRNDKIITSQWGTATLDFEASLASLDADGFTINISTAPASAYTCAYLAMDEANVVVGTTQSPSSATIQALTGAGFSPGAFFAVAGQAASLGINGSQQGRLSIGAADDDQQFVTWVGTTGGEAFCNSLYHQGNVITIANDGASDGEAATLLSQASLQSFDSGGVTLNWHTNDGTARYFHWIMLPEKSDLVRFEYVGSAAPDQTIELAANPRALIGYGNSQTSTGNTFGASIGISLANLELAQPLNERSASIQVSDQPISGIRDARREGDALRSFGCFLHNRSTDPVESFMRNLCNIVNFDFEPAETRVISRYRFASR